MSHFDEFWNRAASAAQTAASATKRAANSAKLSIAIAAEEEKVKAAYQAIGKLYYQDRISAAAPAGPAYDEQVGRIDAALQRIGELRSQRDVTSPAPGLRRRLCRGERLCRRGRGNRYVKKPASRT